MARAELSRLAKAAAVIALVTVPVLAQGPTVTGDTYLQSGTNASQNFGALANILVGPGTGATQNRGLVRFDLSGMSGVSASDVQKAVLWLYVNRVTVAGSVDVYDVTSSWSESTATWNSPPTVGANQGTIAVTAAGQWVGLDITTEVQGWLTLPSNNYGVMLQAFTAPTTSVSLDAKESTATSHPAQLQIVLVGPAGATGPAGAAGPTGATGAAGPSGPSGAAGAAGATGATGVAGPSGAAGAAGATGATGVAGPSGAAGAAGATGATGAQGVQGAAGATGATGAQGVQGAAGATGATGASGAAGANGSTVLNGSGAPSNALGVDGDFYIRTDTNCMYGPKVSSAWPGVCQSLVGPSGATGAAGPSGPTGPAGATGATGPSGAAGAAGPSGPSGAAGASGPSGPSGAAGAAGPSGPSGAQGNTGSTGAAGATGPSGPAGAAGANGGYLLSFSAGESSFTPSTQVFNLQTNQRTQLTTPGTLNAYSNIVGFGYACTLTGLTVTGSANTSDNEVFSVITTSGFGTTYSTAGGVATCTISSGTSSCNWSGSVSIPAGSRVGVSQTIPTGTPASWNVTGAITCR
jgi:hypothetical protein